MRRVPGVRLSLVMEPRSWEWPGLHATAFSSRAKAPPTMSKVQ
jgi:hypothetical protein